MVLFFYLPLASPCQLPMQPRTHLRADFLGQHREAKCFPYLFSVSFPPSSSLPPCRSPLRYPPPLCLVSVCKTKLVLGAGAGTLCRSTPVSHESELRWLCCRFLMQEANRSDHSLCRLPLPLFCFLGRQQESAPCQPTWLQAAQKIPGSSGREPKTTYRPSPSRPRRATSTGLILLLGNASAQCPFKQKSHSP